MFVSSISGAKVIHIASSLEAKPEADFVVLKVCNPKPSSEKFKSLMSVYKALNGTAPIYLNAIAKAYVTTLSLRSTKDCRLAVSTQCLRQSRLFSCVVPQWWNDLPSATRTATATSYHIFLWCEHCSRLTQEQITTVGWHVQSQDGMPECSIIHRILYLKYIITCFTKHLYRLFIYQFISYIHLILQRVTQGSLYTPYCPVDRRHTTHRACIHISFNMLEETGASEAQGDDAKIH